MILVCFIQLQTHNFRKLSYITWPSIDQAFDEHGQDDK